MTDLEGADPASQRGVPPEQRIWKGDPASQRGVPQSSGFGRGGSGLSEGGAPRAAELEGVDPASQVPQRGGWGGGTCRGEEAKEQLIWKGGSGLPEGVPLEGGGPPAGGKGPKSSGKGRGLFRHRNQTSGADLGCQIPG